MEVKRGQLRKKLWLLLVSAAVGAALIELLKEMGVV